VAVLWLSAALAAIAFSIASTVRGELERASTQMDGTRAYYLAAGGLERALLYMQWGQQFTRPDGSSQYFSPGTTRLHFVFPTGEADVEILPESSRLSLNQARPEDLLRLLTALGVERGRAVEIARAVVDWRTRPPEGGLTEFDRYYLSLTPSFRPLHASFRETEELLLVRGMTPELYYGSYERDPQGQWRPVGGLADCVTVYGDAGSVDVNAAPPAVLAAVGLPPDTVELLVRARREQPLRSLQSLGAMRIPDEVLARLGIGGSSIYTVRATARVRTPEGGLSDAARSVGATVSFDGAGPEIGYQVLRWNERLWVRDSL
jgi:general secretion pathway protein K